MLNCANNTSLQSLEMMVEIHKNIFNLIKQEKRNLDQLDQLDQLNEQYFSDETLYIDSKTYPISISIKFKPKNNYCDSAHIAVTCFYDWEKCEKYEFHIGFYLDLAGQRPELYLKCKTIDEVVDNIKKYKNVIKKNSVDFVISPIIENGIRKSLEKICKKELLKNNMFCN